VSGRVVVELFAGLAAWTLYMHDLRPPCSRIGCKSGYAAALVEAFGVPDKPARSLLVEADPQLANALRFLVRQPRDLARTIRLLGGPSSEPRAIWQRAKEEKAAGALLGAASWWIWTAGARGGIGGFKGAHKLRPSVEGFIPTLDSLQRRISLFPALDHVEVIHANAEAVPPMPGARVYLDPPYVGTQVYGGPAPSVEAVCELARQWRDEGALVGVSYNRRLDTYAAGLPEWRALDLTERRRGQVRRSLTRTRDEWLTISAEVSCPGST